MNRLKKKLKSRSGETITETLVALLISAIALLMLAGAISSSVNLVEKSKLRQERYYEANDYLNQKSTSVSGLNTGTGTGEAKIDEVTGTGKGRIMLVPTYNVSYYSNKELSNTPVLVYYYEPGTPGSGG